jgi:hypothetical protein
MTWQRLEGGTVAADLVEGQEARIADPLWLVGRQWQVGELSGDDAASPLLVEAEIEEAPVTRLQPGLPGAGPSVDVAGRPVETAVEREDPWTTRAAVRLAAEAGLQLLRILGERGTPDVRDALRREYPLRPPADDGLDPAGWAQLRLLARRSFDGRALRAATRPPSALDSSAGRAALDTWRRWYDALYPVPATGPSWQPRRMEYRFRLGAHPRTGAEIVLDATEYAGGHLDWYSFDRRDDLAPLGAEPAGRRRTLTVLPTPVTFAGQAASRWWQLEDGAVSFGDLHVGPEDLPRILLASFAAGFGDDWFVIPMTIGAARIARTTRLRVLDSFGDVTDVRSCAELDGPRRPWRFFELTGDPSADAASLADRTAPWLFLAPALSGVVEGPPREEVLLLRDEIANVGWAAELRVEAASGRPVDRGPGALPVTAPAGDAWRYTLAPPVPGNLLPLLPVNPAGSGLFLQRGRLPGDAPGASGEILTPGRRLLIEDGQVPTSGVRITRSWQLARTHDGGFVLWTGRSKTLPPPQTAPGLEFDTIETS